MAVESCHLYVAALKRGFYESVCLTCIDWDAELRIHLAGIDSLKSMRIKSAGESQKNLLRYSLICSHPVKHLKLVEIINYKVSYAAFYAVFDIRISLVGAVEEHLRCRKSRSKSRIDFARRHYIHTQSLGLNNRINSLEAKCLARVKRSGLRSEALLHGVYVCPAVAAYHIFVKYIKRRAEFCGKLCSIESADSKMTFFIYGQVVI